MSRIKHVILALTLEAISLFLPFLLVVLPVRAIDLTVVNTDDSGSGSLRQAIADAEDGDTILFDSSLNGQTITLTSGELLITKNLTISGPGANLLAIGGNNASRVFNITSTVTISGVMIKEGKEGDTYFSRGGGIYNGGTINLINTIVFSNTSDDSGGGIYNNGTVNLINSTVSGNMAYFGGGILNNGGGIVNLTDSTVSGNTANQGGGIYNLPSRFSATVNLTNSIISDNTAWLGGGIANHFDGGIVNLTNSTVSGNMAEFWGGGGLSNKFENSPIYLTNSIIANNSNGNDCSGVIISQGYNLDSDNTCNLIATGDITNTNPLLSPLADNDGSTFTHALLDSSPALDAGSCPGTTSDQRGFTRPIDIPTFSNVDDGCDIGAYELDPSQSPPTTPVFLPIVLKQS